MLSAKIQTETNFSPSWATNPLLLLSHFSRVRLCVTTRLPGPCDSPGKNTGVGCHFLLQRMKVKSEVALSCPTLSDPMDCSLPGSSVHGILQARVLEWGAIAFSRQEYWSGVPLPSPTNPLSSPNCRHFRNRCDSLTKLLTGRTLPNCAPRNHFSAAGRN